MQTIFALHTAREAEYNISLAKVEDNFLPDLNSMEEQDKDQLSKDRKTAGACFKNAFHNGMDNLDPDVTSEVVVVVSNGLTDYENQVTDLKRSYKKRLISETKGIFDQYLQLLSLISEIKRVSESFLKPDQKSNFISNKIIEGLNNSSEFESLLIKKNLTWQNEQSNIRTWVKEIIKKDPSFLKYEGLSGPTFEEDLSIILYIYKSLVFKNETIKAHFEISDLGWTENSSVLKSMVLKTFKSIDEEENEPVLMELSKNWVDDLLFLENIFDYSVNNEEEYKEIVAEKSKNWDIDRVALTDKIILEMALAEMVNFNSIPIKVTINEYIEISKLYSTPKSKQFINGLLDVLSEELKKEGKIKKSGRGLLDNK
jgi:N utilization substance protein B